MISQRPLIYDLTFAELEDYYKLKDEPAYRAEQTWVALYKQFKVVVDDFSTLPADLRAQLAEDFLFAGLTPLRTIGSEDGQTVKTLFKLHDGALIEAVLMRYEDRRTLCISSQSGCGLGCSFCATGQMGFSRNLTSGEIVAQVIFFARELEKTEERVTNVVLMGMGEPFANYDQVMAAMERLNDPRGFGLGARRMTISTVGLAPKIRQFADTESQINLAVSLHTVDDELRSQLMPINKKYPVAKLLDACRYYVEKTNRRLTFEYALIDDVNDAPEDARALARDLKGLLCHVNLIPLNPTRAYAKAGSPADRAQAFCDVLGESNIPCTIRLRRGIDIGAGCGQLAAETL
jgi:23S rRNA (adenine2503-C2)-methyltransferase